jgi:hypothetical protein
MNTLSTLTRLAAILACSIAPLSNAQVPTKPQRLFSCSLQKFDWQDPAARVVGEPVEVALLIDGDVPTSGITVSAIAGIAIVAPSKLKISDPGHLLWPADSAPTRIAYEGVDQAIFSVHVESTTGPRAWLRIFDTPASADAAVLDADLILMREGVKPITAAVSKMRGSCRFERGADIAQKFEALK